MDREMQDDKRFEIENTGSENGLMETEAESASKRWHFVLVHGAMHGAWCWYKIVELLEKDGHRVTAIDLKSAGTHPSAADSINSFDEYNQPLMDFLAHLPLTEKIVLVGHSMGGVSIARASQAFPHLIAVAVYLCALMFRGGERLEWERKYMLPHKEIAQHLEFGFANSAEDSPTSITMPKKFLKDYFYNESSPLDAALGSLSIRPLPYMAMVNIDLTTTQERYGAVPRVYIKTDEDKVLLAGKQEELIRASPPEQMYTLHSDHSPFFSASEKLHHFLLQIAMTYS